MGSIDLIPDVRGAARFSKPRGMADPLRIVQVAPPYFDVPPKGYVRVEVVVADLVDALVVHGHDVTVLGAGAPGGGRKKLSDTDPGLLAELKALVDRQTRGDPCSPLVWTTKSTRNLAGALTAAGHRVSDRTVARMLAAMGFSGSTKRSSARPADVLIPGGGVGDRPSLNGS